MYICDTPVPICQVPFLGRNNCNLFLVQPPPGLILEHFLTFSSSPKRNSPTPSSPRQPRIYILFFDLRILNISQKKSHKYVAISGWLLSFSITFSRTIHVTHINTSFVFVKNIPLSGYTTFYLSFNYWIFRLFPLFSYYE